MLPFVNTNALGRYATVDLDPNACEALRVCPFLDTKILPSVEVEVKP